MDPAQGPVSLPLEALTGVDRQAVLLALDVFYGNLEPVDAPDLGDLNKKGYR